jgi:hypothetical protein
MKIQRSGKDKRIKPGGAHPWFAKNLGIWKDLNLGKVIEIPEEVAGSIVDLFGDSIKKVKETIEKLKPSNNGGKKEGGVK